MDLRKLRYFVHVAELGGFGRAARSLGVAQPALSRHVRDLERELGVRLLHRNGRGVLLTDAGMHLLPRAKSIVEDAERAAREVQAFSAMPVGTVAIGVPPSVSQILLTPFVRRSQARYPGIQLRIVEGFSGYIQEWLLTGRIDVAVLYGQRRNPAVASEELLVEDMCLVGAASDPRMAADEVPLSSLAGLPLILPSRPHGLRLLVDGVTAASRVDLVVTVEIDALPTIKDLVATTGAYTILPFSAVHREVTAGLLRAAPIVDPPIPRTLLLATSIQRSPSLATQCITALVREQVAELVQAGLWLRRGSRR